MGTHVLLFRSLPIAVSCLLHLDSYKHSSSRCTVVTINMYTKAIALAILAVAGVQAQSDYDYEDSDPTPTMASASYMPIYTGAASAQKAAGGVAGLGLALIGLL